MNFIDRRIGIFVGKFALRAQLLPVGKLTGLKWVWAKLFYNAKKIAELNSEWDTFVAKAKKYKPKDASNRLIVNRAIMDATQDSKLDTAEIYTEKNKNCKEYIIYVWGRNDIYENYLNIMARHALNLNKKIITFNYRNVGRSEGQVACEQDLVNDIKFQIKRLKNKGISSTNISLYGLSMGGANVALAASQLREEGFPLKSLKSYHDRTYANLHKVSDALFFNRGRKLRPVIIGVLTSAMAVAAVSVLWLIGAMSIVSSLVALAATALALAIPPIRRLNEDWLGGRLVRYGLYFVMHRGGWDSDIPKAVETIPRTHRMHAVVQKSKSHFSETLGVKHEICRPEIIDRVIYYEDSLHDNLQIDKDKKRALKKQYLTLSKNPTSKNKAAMLRISNELRDMTNCKVTGADHLADMNQLVCRYKSGSGRQLTAEERYFKFAEPNGPHDLPKKHKYVNF